MKRLRNHLIGVDHGDVVLFSDFEDDGVMWTGDCARQTRAHVDFSESFRAAPIVQVNLSMWDIASQTSARADVQAEDISEDGFVIVFRTWGDTKIARDRVAWQAIGELRQAVEWELY
jgi:hypothetical protein